MPATWIIEVSSSNIINEALIANPWKTDQFHMILSHVVQEFISSSLLSSVAPNNHANGKLWVTREI